MLHSHEQNTLHRYTKVLHNPDIHDASLVSAAGIITALLHEISEHRHTNKVEPLLDRKQVAQILGVVPDTVSRIAERGEIIASSIGADSLKPRLRFTRTAVDEYLASTRLRPVRYKPQPRGAA